MADFTGTYGPFYGGMLGKQLLNQQSAMGENQALQGTLGLLGQMARQQEQNELIRQQVELAKLKAVKENTLMDMFLGGGAGGAPGAAEGALAQGAAQGDIGPTVTNAQRMGAPSAPQGGSVPGANFSPQQWTALSFLNPQASNALVKHQEIAQKDRQFDVERNTLSAKDREDVRLREGGLQMEMERLRADLMKWQGLSGAEQFNVRARIAEMRDKGVLDPQTAGALLQQTGPGAGQAPPAALRPAPQAASSDMVVAPGVQAGRDDRRMQILQGELEAERAAGNTQNVADLEREIGMLQGRRPAPAAAPTQPQGPAPIQVSPEERRKLETERPQATAAMRSSIGALSRLETLASDLSNHVGLQGITGTQSYFPNIRGSRAANAQAELDTLKNQVFIGALQSMRDASKTGGALGSITEKEATRLENAWAALQNAQGVSQMRSALRQVAEIARSGQRNIQDSFSMTYPGQAPAPGPTQPAGAPASAGSRVVDFNSWGRSR